MFVWLIRRRLRGDWLTEGVPVVIRGLSYLKWLFYKASCETVFFLNTITHLTESPIMNDVGEELLSRMVFLSSLFS